MVNFIKKNNFFIFVILILLCIIIFCLFFFHDSEEKNYDLLKRNSSFDFVYLTEKTYSFGRVPKFNIIGSQVDNLNQKIENDYAKFENRIGVACQTKYYLSSSIISLVVEFTYSEEGNTLYETTEYFTYNYDLENEQVLDSEKLLSYFDLSLDDVDSFLEQKFLNSYYSLIDKDEIDPSTCNFQCFLDSKQIDDYISNVSFSVEKGSLICYRPFVITPINYDYLNFTSEDFRFVIIK